MLGKSFFTYAPDACIVNWHLLWYKFEMVL